MAVGIVGSLFAQEKFDSLSYAMGVEYIRNSDLNLSEIIQQSVNDREEFVRGFSDGLKRTAATSYHDGYRMGFYVLIADDVTLPLDCLLEGVRKVADNTVVLPRDTIGAYQLFNGYGVMAMPMVDAGNCRFATMMGILCGLSAIVPDRLMSDSITIEDQQAFAAGMADMLETSDSMAAYDEGKLAVAFFFPDVMIMKKNRGLDLVDYDAIIDGVRGALELAERKMSVEEVEMCLMQYYAEEYNIQTAEELDYNDDIDDIIIEEEAAKEALYDFEVDGIYYLINGNEATVTHKDGNSPKNPCYSGELAIPATVTYNGVTYSVTSIGSHAFKGCRGLTSIEIPNSVTTISDMAFNECSGLKDVYSYIDNLSLVSMGSSVFYVYPAKYNKRTLHVPVGTLKAYQADTKWSEYFGNIVEMEP